MRTPCAFRRVIGLLVVAALHGVEGVRSSSSDALLGTPAALLESTSEWPLRWMTAPLSLAPASRTPSASAPRRALPRPRTRTADVDSRSAVGRTTGLGLFQREDDLGPLSGPSELEVAGVDAVGFPGQRTAHTPAKRVLLPARGLFFLDDSMTLVNVPSEWACKLDAENLEIRFGSYQEIFLARMKGEPSKKLSFLALNDTLLFDRRHLFMIRRLHGIPNIVTCFDVQVFPDAMYLLTEPFDGDLLESYQGWIGSQLPAPPELRAEDWLRRTLPLLVDILYAAVGLEGASVVHPFMWENDVQVTNGRAVLAGFEHMCVLEAGEAFGCDSYDQFDEPVLRSAPEMVHGRPTGSSNTVWAVGMMFAALCLGDIPTRHLVTRELPGVFGWGADADEASREAVRRIIRERFVVYKHPNFWDLDHDVQEFLAGVLEIDPNQRWSAQGALSFASKMSRDRGIAVPAPRAIPTLPIDWLDWQ